MAWGISSNAYHGIRLRLLGRRLTDGLPTLHGTLYERSPEVPHLCTPSLILPNWLISIYKLPAQSLLVRGHWTDNADTT